MSDLNDCLKLQIKGSPLTGESSLASHVRPSASGFKWLASPSSMAGLAYRINGSTILERLEFDDESDIKVSASIAVDNAVVHLAASFDGRLVAAACTDGSLHCFDSTSAGLKHRWSLPDAHSHIVSDLSSTPSKDRSNAAAKSGPVRSLSFSPDGYELLLVDSGNRGLSIYNAAQSNPTNALQKALSTTSCATWCPTTRSQSGSHFAVGDITGSIEIYKYYESNSESVAKFETPNDEADFVCTHLDWSNDTLFVGLCKVIPSDEEDDEDDEDDTALHEALVYVAAIDPTNFSVSKWHELGDVVPFFTVPKHGRHVFFTSFLKSKKQLCAVVANVGSDVVILSHVGSKWEMVELQEGSEVTTPTDEDDEYTFPVGVEITQIASGAFRLLLACTDGSLSCFSIENKEDPNYFFAPASTITLSDSPVETIESSSPPELTNEPSIKAQIGEATKIPSNPTSSSGFS